LHLVASSTVWYAARAGGVVSYVLISASVLAGILLAGKKRVPGLPRFAVEDVHRFLGLLAGLFITIHVGSIALDTVVPFSLSQLVIPFTASYRPLATGLGIVALELLLAVAVTNRLRVRLPYTVWRRAHYATLAVWLLATVHGILSGTDRSETWLLAVYATTVALVAGAAVLRFGRAPTPRRLAAGLAVGAGACALVLGLSAIPQQASTSKTSSTTATVASIPDINGSITGTIDQSDASGIVSISGTAASQSSFRIDLLTGGNEVADTAIQLQFASGTICEGTLTALDDTGFTGTCTLPGGGTRTVSSTWTVSNGTVDGTISTTGGSSSTTDA
jgi:sulfoxide reductase heme-binding subunit YedZ